MRIGERLHVQDDGSVVQQKTWDPNPALDLARTMRDRGADFGESRAIGVVPAELLEAWVIEAGVRFDDHAAVDEIVRRKLASGEFLKLRVSEGKL